MGVCLQSTRQDGGPGCDTARRTRTRAGGRPTGKTATDARRALHGRCGSLRAVYARPNARRGACECRRGQVHRASRRWHAGIGSAPGGAVPSGPSARRGWCEWCGWGGKCTARVVRVVRSAASGRRGWCGWWGGARCTARRCEWCGRPKCTARPVRVVRWAAKCTARVVQVVPWARVRARPSSSSAPGRPSARDHRVQVVPPALSARRGSCKWGARGGQVHGAARASGAGRPNARRGSCEWWVRDQVHGRSPVRCARRPNARDHGCKWAPPATECTARLVRVPSPPTAPVAGAPRSPTRCPPERGDRGGPTQRAEAVHH